MRRRIKKMTAKSRRLAAKVKHHKVKVKSRRGRRPQTPDELRTLLKGQRRENKQLREIIGESWATVNNVMLTLSRLEQKYSLEKCGHPADGM